MKEDDRSVYWMVAKRYDLENKMREFGKNIAIQGEVCGPGIQKNRLMLKDVDLFVFDVYDIDQNKYMTFPEAQNVIGELGLKSVPFEETGDHFDYSMEMLLGMAIGKYDGTSNNREGIVVRAMFGDFSQKFRDRISFKVLNNVFLLEEKE